MTYYSEHKKERLEYYIKRRDQEIIRRRKLRKGNVNAPIPKYGERNKGLYNKTGKGYKSGVFDHYGTVCVCCGERNSKLLTIDHILDNGKEHGTKNNRHKGEALYRYLVKNSFPTGIQVLCFNCNIGRRNNKGVCPHKGEKAII